MTGRDLYGDRLDGEVESLYRQGLFPMTDHLGSIGEIITRCWREEYDSADYVYAGIQGLDFLLNLVSCLIK
jgi:hypothetical protein